MRAYKICYNLYCNVKLPYLDALLAVSMCFFCSLRWRHLQGLSDLTLSAMREKRDVNSLSYSLRLTLSSIYTHFNTLKGKSYKKTLWKKVKLLKMSNFTFIHNDFHAICILKSFNIIARFQLSSAASFNLGRSQNGSIREWVNPLPHNPDL